MILILYYNKIVMLSVIILFLYMILEYLIINFKNFLKKKFYKIIVHYSYLILQTHK